MTEKELELIIETSVKVDKIFKRLEVIEDHLFKTKRVRHDLLGMEVTSVGGSATRCVGCPQETEGCVKVELVGGDFLCLAKPQQDDDNEKHVISFEENINEGLGDIMARIKKDTEAFIDYFDDITGGK